MTAIELQVLLHYYHGRGPIRRTTLAEASAEESLSNQGLLNGLHETEQGGPFMKESVTDITDKGRFHVDTLLKHPLPRKVETFGYPE